MDRQESGAVDWLNEVLRGAGIDPSRLARVNSVRRPVIERSNPWHDHEGIEDSATVLDAVRAAAADRSRLLFVTDVDEDPIARVQAAVQLARAAVARGVDVLLVDADIRHVGLSRWLPDRDLDAEGLVDVLQYGASVVAARRPSQLDGIDLLGVGSYRPDLSGIFGADDARRLQAQLRASASLVIVVAPARLAGGEFHPLLRGVDAVVLSLHADPATAAELSALLEHLSARQLPLAGIFVWAGPGDADRFVDDALLERSRALPPANPASPFPARRSEPDAVTGEVGRESGLAPVEPAAPAWPPAEPEPGLEVEPRSGSESPAGDAAAEPESEPVGPQSVRMYTERGGRRAPRRSSRAPRIALGIVAVAIVAFVGWWGLTWRSVEPTRPRIQPPERRTTAARPTPSEPAPGGATQATPPENAAASPPAETDAAQAGEPAAEDAERAVETSRDLDGLLAAPVESGEGPAASEAEVGDEPGPAPATRTDPFEAALRRQGGGWALHLFSFPDSMEAVADARRLEVQGYATAIRGAEIKGRRWFRVLVGDFPDRAAAAVHREDAQEKFHVDWVGVVKK